MSAPLSRGVVVPMQRQKDPTEDDGVIIARIAGGNLAALGILHDRHSDAVRRFVLRATNRGNDADDLVQETFLTLMRIAGTYDGRPSARAFLVGIAAQLVRQSARKRARWSNALTEIGTTFARVVGSTPEARAMVTEELATADAVLNGLSEEKRMVFLMIEGEGLSGEEVAAALGIPAATVWTRLHYARIDLRRTLAKRGIQ
jgi:RNA polymerase sigma-70 factor (ECF subfamily)